MRMLLKGTAMALALAGTMLATAGTSNAAGFAVTTSDRGYSHSGTSVSFSFGDVAYGYQDGYWDNSHRWQNWRNDRDRQYYRDNYRDNYRSGYHHRYPGLGWMGDRSVTSVSFNFGDVAYGYQDGYWDNSHRWQNWRNDRDRQYYRDNYRDNYRSGYHTRYSSQGWMGDRSATSVSFSLGDVAYGYRDGYWDNSHRWHKWRNRSDHDNYRNHQGNNYRSGSHNRYRGQGWQRD